MNTTTMNPNVDLNEVSLASPSMAAPFSPMGAVAEDEGTEARTDGIRELGPELGVAGFLMLLGALVVFDSLRLGAGWADDGPQSGYFPFYIGVMLFASSGFVLAKALACWFSAKADPAAAKPALLTRTFVGRDELQLVMAMLVPATLYVVAMGFVGLYLSSIVLIAYFMRRHGGFSWALSSVVAVGVPLTVFIVFERWFLVPLPKGPIESLLGF